VEGGVQLGHDGAEGGEEVSGGPDVGLVRVGVAADLEGFLVVGDGAELGDEVRVRGGGEGRGDLFEARPRVAAMVGPAGGVGGEFLVGEREGEELFGDMEGLLEGGGRDAVVGDRDEPEFAAGGDEGFGDGEALLRGAAVGGPGREVDDWNGWVGRSSVRDGFAGRHFGRRDDSALTTMVWLDRMRCEFE
jgi:hypothetical protein